MLKHYPELKKHRMGSKPFLKELSKVIKKSFKHKGKEFDKLISYALK